MAKIIIRQDDFDFRLEPKAYIDNHEKFIKAGLIETAVVQYTHDGNQPKYPMDLINYMRTSPNWDIQLHGWSHDDYSKLPRWIIREHLVRSRDMSVRLFGVEPTIWFPPWNCNSDDMKEVADSFGMTIDNESYDISKFIREVKAGTFEGHSVYFHLWNRDEAAKIDEMIECAKSLL
ncbi:polysaccharide deacetylase family protein [Candidatus Dojkabacteria bacterium]|jgi:peptidoglycan/xylan/chitin deacetylase (PgdA/CDA1 family)|nr:polysaccharide deacetylase family protein [Candidatus Dojkabacteria bacterium]